MATSLVIACQCAAARAQSAANSADDTLCAFRPQAAICEKLYQHALTSSRPTADAVKAAYQAYGKYLKPGGQGLTAADRKYLENNQIDLPADLDASDLAGLHYLITGPVADERRAAHHRDQFPKPRGRSRAILPIQPCDANAGAPLTS